MSFNSILGVFVNGLFIFCCHVGVLFADALTIDTVESSSFVNIDKLSLFDDTNGLIYSPNGEKKILQVYRLEGEEYVLNQELDLFENQVVCLIRKVNNTLMLIGGNSISRYSIMADGLLESIDQTEFDSVFTESYLEISELRFVTKLGNELTFWEINENDSTIVPMFESVYTDNFSHATYDRMVMNESNNSLWFFNKFDENVNIKEFSIDYQSEALVLLNTISLNIPSTGEEYVVLLKANSSDLNFFIKTNVSEYFITIENNLTAKLDSRIIVNTQNVSTNAKRDDFISYFYTSDPEYYPELSTINWNTLSIDYSVLSFPLKIDFDFESESYLDSSGVISFIGQDKMLLHFNSYNEYHIYSNIDSGIDSARIVSLGSLDLLPTRLEQTFFSKETNQLALIGELNNSFKRSIFLWSYDLENGLFVHNKRVDLESEISEKNNVDYSIIGFIDNDLYITRTYNNLNQTDVIRIRPNVYTVSNADINTLPTLPIVGDGEYSLVQQAFLADSNTVAVLRNNQSQFLVTLCSLPILDANSDCTIKSPIDGYSPTSFREYRFQHLSPVDQFILADTRASSIGESKSFVLAFDQSSMSFERIQELENAPSYQNPDWTDGISLAYLTANSKDLYVGSQRLHHYQKDANTGDWVLGEIAYNFNLGAISLNDRDDYFISRDGRTVGVLDSLDKKLFRQDSSGIPVNGESYWFLPNDKGFFVGGNQLSRLATYSINDSSPTFYKGGMDFGLINILQDEQVNIDVSPYYYNVQNIAVSGLPQSLSWQPPFITGSLSNADMFDSIDVTDLTPARDSTIGFHINSINNPLESSFVIRPVNVNDPPELISALETQYFDVNETYQADFSTLVIDPDRDELFFSYDNVPGSFSTASTGLVTGSISTVGSYTMNVTAMDPQGSTFQFDVNIVVQAVVSNENSSGGGGGALSTLFLLAFLLHSRRRE